MRKIMDLCLRRPLFFGALFLMPFFAFYSCFIYSPPALSFYDGQMITVTGVVEDKILNETGYVDSLCIAGKYGFKCYPSDTGGCDLRIFIGSPVSVTGRFKSFRKATNPGEFDSQRFNENRGFLFYLSDCEITLLSDSKDPIGEFFFRMRKHCCEIVLKYCPREGGTINTLLFGEKSGLDRDRQNTYKMAGLAHFLVISGLHVSVAGGGIYILLRNLGMKRGPAAALGMVFIIFYGLLVGFTVSVMRAIIMYLLRLGADIFNRTYDILSALGIAAVITLLKEPLMIRDSAFLYSYCAVLFVGLYMTYLKRDSDRDAFMKLYSKKGYKFRLAQLRSAARVPLVLYLGLLPVSLYFQSFSNILGILLNLCLGLLTAPVLLCSALGFLFGSLDLKLLASLADLFCGLLLKLIDLASQVMSTIHFAYIANKPSLGCIFVYYLVLLILLFSRWKWIPESVTYFVMLTIVLFISTNFSPYPSFTALDVDQGDCIVIRTGLNSAIISDCGSTGRSDIGKNVVFPYLLSQGITRIDDIFISHSDSDHINGIEYLLENSGKSPILIRRVVFPLLNSENWDEKLEKIRIDAIAAGVRTTFATRLDSFFYGKTRVCVLYPSLDSLAGVSNADSMILWVNYRTTDILLTGDATAETEERLILPQNVSFEILKVAHHGSRFSTTESFLKVLDPDIAVISAGRNNNYGHPHADTLSRLESSGATIFRTDRLGAITIPLRDGGLGTFLSPPIGGMGTFLPPPTGGTGTGLVSPPH